MTEPGQGDRTPPALRVTVVLGGSEPSHTLLDALIPLVSGRSVEVLGLFVEDDALLRLAGLPFSQELCRLTFAERRLDPAELEHQFRLRARLARRALETALGVEHCSFRSERGRISALLAQAATEVDVLFLGPGRTPFAPATRRAEAAPGASPRSRITVACTASPAGERALAIGALIARARERPLTVFALPSAAQPGPAGPDRLAQLARSQAVEVDASLTPGDAEALVLATRRRRADVLVVEAVPEFMGDAALRLLYEGPGCPVILVR